MLCKYTWCRALWTCDEPPTAYPRTGPVFRGCPARYDPSSQDDGSSQRQLVRVSCASVVVVCLCVLRVTCTRVVDQKKHWIVSLQEKCLPCICCLIQTGHVLWVSLPGPTGVPSDAQAERHRGQSANPFLLHCCTAQPALTRTTEHTSSVKHTCRGFWPTWTAPTTVFVSFTRS